MSRTIGAHDSVQLEVKVTTPDWSQELQGGYYGALSGSNSISIIVDGLVPSAP